MTERGLREVKNPSAIFLSRTDKASPGSLISVLWEGTRPLLLEIQALVVTAQYGSPRRFGIGLDQNRIAMILAVLAKHGGLVLCDQDIFVNLVGGVKTSETSSDLSVALAIVSSLQNKTLPQDLVVFGEVGLSGEIRPVSNGEARLKESSKHGFTRAIVPKGNVPKQGISGMQITGVADLNEALDAINSIGDSAAE